MSTTLHVHSGLADRRFGVNGASFFLATPLIIPNPDWEFRVVLSHMQIPLSYYTIDGLNDRITAVYFSGSATITLPHGNLPIDDIIASINSQLLDGFRAAYDDNTNKVTFSSDNPGPDNFLTFGTDSTGLGLIGASTSDVSVGGVLACQDTVNLAGPLALYVRSNFSTTLLDPKSKAQSNILAKVPITRQPFDIETFESDASFSIPDRVVSGVAIYIEDHLGRQLDFHGADFAATLAFHAVERVKIPAATDYRLTLMQEDAARESTGGPGGAQPTRDSGPPS